MLIFKPEFHQYESIDPLEKIDWLSCTTFISHFKQPFDPGPQSIKSSKNKNSKWFGISPDEIQRIWKGEGDRSIDLGHWYHNQRESDITEFNTIEREGISIPIIKPIFIDGIKHAPDQILFNGVYPEHLVYLKSLGLCGQSDRVEVVKNIVNISDYKSNKEIKFNGYTNWEGITQMMNEPISHLEDCVAGNTKLITKNGIENIEDCIGKEIEIWNGDKWSTVTPFSTGNNRELYRISFTDGSYLDVTDNHKFLIKHRLDKGFYEKTTSEIIKMFSTTKWSLRLPRANVKYNDGQNVEYAYDYGFILGDGCVDGKRVKAGLYNKDKLLQFKSSTTRKTYIRNGKEFDLIYFDVDVEFCKKLKYKNGLPKEIFSWNKKSILEFIAGWADADGTLSNKSMLIYGREDKIRDLQLLLTKCNINSSCCLFQKKGVKTNLCIRKNSLYYICIQKIIDIPTQRLMSNNIIEAKGKGKYQIIKNIEKLKGLHNTYCLTEDELHQCVFNNVLTKQCHIVHYGLQLSLYLYMILRYNPKLIPGKLTIDHIIFVEESKDQYGYPIYKKDSQGNFELKELKHYEVPYYKSEIITMLEYLKENRNLIKKK